MRYLTDSDVEAASKETGLSYATTLRIATIADARAESLVRSPLPLGNQVVSLRSKTSVTLVAKAYYILLLKALAAAAAGKAAPPITPAGGLGGIFGLGVVTGMPPAAGGPEFPPPSEGGAGGGGGGGGGGPPPTFDFRLDLTSTSGSVNAGSKFSIPLGITLVSGTGQPVYLSTQADVGAFSPLFVPNPIDLSKGQTTGVLNLDIPSSTASGTYNIIITAQSGGISKTAVFALKVIGQAAPPTAFDFSMAMNTTDITLYQGESTVVPLTFSVKGTPPIDLSLMGDTQNLDVYLLNATQRTDIGVLGNEVHIHAHSDATPGDYSYTIRALGGGVQKVIAFVVHVKQSIQAAINYALNFNQTDLTLYQGDTKDIPFNATMISGAAGPITLSTDLSSNVASITFIPNPLPLQLGQSNGTMRISVPDSAPVGDFTFNATGALAGILKKIPFRLRILAKIISQPYTGDYYTVNMAWAASAAEGGADVTVPGTVTLNPVNDDVKSGRWVLQLMAKGLDDTVPGRFTGGQVIGPLTVPGFDPATFSYPSGPSASFTFKIQGVQNLFAGTYRYNVIAHTITYGSATAPPQDKTIGTFVLTVTAAAPPPPPPPAVQPIDRNWVYAQIGAKFTNDISSLVPQTGAANAQFGVHAPDDPGTDTSHAYVETPSAHTAMIAKGWTFKNLGTMAGGTIQLWSVWNDAYAQSITQGRPLTPL